MPDHPKLNPQSLSLAMWLYLPADPNCSTADNWRSLIHKGAVAAGASGYSVQLGEHRTLNFDTGTGTGSPDSWSPVGLALPMGRWTHLVFTHDASTGLKQAFVNGVLKDSKVGTAAPMAANTSPLVVNNAAASACTAGSGHFDGALDDLRLYGRTLSPSEVTALFAPVTLSPAFHSMKPGATSTFAASRPDGRTAPITWAASGGTIGADGVFTAPLNPGIYSVTATSDLDPTLPAVAMVDVRDFDAAEEFSLAANPNGAWSYGWTGTLGSGFTPFVNHLLAANGLETWETSGTPVITHNPTPGNVTSNTTTLTPNQLSLHPGAGGQYAVLRWKAAEAGSVDVTAAFLGTDSRPTTTDVHVLLNGVAKFDGVVEAFHAGPSYQGTLTVQAGDTVDVAVGYGNGNYTYDSTGVRFRINKVVPASPAPAGPAPERDEKSPSGGEDLRLRLKDSTEAPVRTLFDVKVVAGDGETPVPGAVLSLSIGDRRVELARVPFGTKDTDTLQGSFLGPEAADLRLEASFTPRRQLEAVTVGLGPRPSGGTLQATLALPLTVIRTRLLETNGTDLEGQGLDAKAPRDQGEADSQPTASIQGKLYGLALGEPSGARLDLLLYDPASGLGVLRSVTVPPLGTHLEVSAPLAPHAWLRSAVLTSAPNAPYLLVALGRGSKDLVKPEAASWLQGPLGFGPLPLPVFMSEEDLEADLGIRPAAEVPDPEHPPQPVLDWRPKVRIPLSGPIWAAAWTLRADDQGDGTFNLWPRLEPYGRGTLNAAENQEVTASLTPSSWVWKERSLRVMDAQKQPLPDQAVEVWPHAAPGAWRIDTDEALSNAQGVWTLSLPLGLKLHAQTAEPESADGSWRYGVVEFVADDPALGEPPVLIPKETRDLPPYPPALTKEQALLAKKRGRRKPSRLRSRKAGWR